MLRAATLFAFLPVTLAVAAPAPPPSEKELIAKLWGKTVAVNDRYEFSMRGKQLVIRTAGLPARGLLYKDKADMPRVTRVVTGDFEATVKVVDASAPNPKAKHESSWPGTRAGLFVSGGGFGLELHLYQYHTKLNGVPREELTRTVWVDAWVLNGGSGSSLKAPEPGKSTWLRITRKGDTISVSYSFDGKQWSAPHTPRRELTFPDDVTIGVFVSSTTYQSADAAFDEFTIKPLKDVPK